MRPNDSWGGTTRAVPMRAIGTGSAGSERYTRATARTCSSQPSMSA